MAKPPKNKNRKSKTAPGAITVDYLPYLGEAARKQIEEAMAAIAAESNKAPEKVDKAKTPTLDYLPNLGKAAQKQIELALQASNGQQDAPKATKLTADKQLENQNNDKIVDILLKKLARAAGFKNLNSFIFVLKKLAEKEKQKQEENQSKKRNDAIPQFSKLTQNSTKLFASMGDEQRKTNNLLQQLLSAIQNINNSQTNDISLSNNNIAQRTTNANKNNTGFNIPIPGKKRPQPGPGPGPKSGPGRWGLIGKIAALGAALGAGAGALWSSTNRDSPSASPGDGQQPPQRSWWNRLAPALVHPVVEAPAPQVVTNNSQTFVGPPPPPPLASLWNRPPEASLRPQVDATLVAPQSAPGTDTQSDRLVQPVNGPITSLFGPRKLGNDNRHHNGMDFGVGVGTSVISAMAGKVEAAGSSQGGYGNRVIIKNGGGLQTLYAHLDKIDVKEGQEVQAGSKIATSGNTGYSTGPHLHFEVIKNGQKVDPAQFLPGANITNLHEKPAVAATPDAHAEPVTNDAATAATQSQSANAQPTDNQSGNSSQSGAELAAASAEQHRQETAPPNVNVVDNGSGGGGDGGNNRANLAFSSINPYEPGLIEPADARERYAKLFEEAA